MSKSVSYIFNFKSEVRDLKRQYAEAFNKIRHAEWEDDMPYAERPYSKWGTYYFHKVEFVEGKEAKDGKIKVRFYNPMIPINAYMSIGNMNSFEDINNIKKCANLHQSCMWDGNNARYILLTENDAFSKWFEEKDKSMARAHTLDHEVGHVLVPGGYETAYEDNPFSECAAEAFAAIRCFQRFGDDANEFLSRASWVYAYNFLHKNSSDHMVVTVIDKIIEDSRLEDFSKLTPMQTIERAERYAKMLTPSQENLVALRETYASFKDKMTWGADKKLDLLLNTCLATSNDFAFYIGAKFFQPLLNPDGVILSGQHFALEKSDCEDYSHRIEARADQAAVTNIFNEKAMVEQNIIKQTLLAVTPASLKLQTSALRR